MYGGIVSCRHSLIPFVRDLTANGRGTCTLAARMPTQRYAAQSRGSLIYSLTLFRISDVYSEFDGGGRPPESEAKNISGPATSTIITPNNRTHCVCNTRNTGSSSELKTEVICFCNASQMHARSQCTRVRHVGVVCAELCVCVCTI